MSPPLTVAWSAIDVPTVALAGCWLVVIVGLAGLTTTCSLLLLISKAELLFESPL
jgi:hypothetical protein